MCQFVPRLSSWALGQIYGSETIYCAIEVELFRDCFLDVSWHRGFITVLASLISIHGLSTPTFTLFSEPIKTLVGVMVVIISLLEKDTRWDFGLTSAP